MVAQRRANTATNGTATDLRLVKNGSDNAAVIPIIPMRAPRLCACGCGDTFTPTRNSHRYVNHKHAEARFQADKKDALMLVVETFLTERGASPETAARRALQAADFYAAAWYKCLERCGMSYDTKLKEWKA